MMELIRGLYYPLLVPWTKTFALNKQLLVIRMEQYTSQIADVLRGVFVFLDLELPTNEVMQQILNKTVQNQGDKLMKEKTGPMLLETRKLLGEFYAPYNRQLAKLLNDEAYLWND
ncbi:carbohydrate sulfotransferase 15-like isoform X2 [Corticium candelabrum]|uniref:carbohydrate sulfotransferase 15-like isoform X2 n=1 Tax=Corticium candelabrum TaxID=121492 RepID=UPI002E26717E|nr:carbohydrate sulfotransferase 15-like isoform X2 [Corticium candelabrum]